MIAHWDEATSGRAEAGHIAGEWTDLGAAAGTKTVGLNRIQVDPGKWSTPFHRQTAEEEIFFVLAGSGVCLLEAPHIHSADEEIFVVLEGEGVFGLWPSPQLARGGREYEEQAIRAGTVISRPASSGVAHGIRAGASGLTYLAYGTRKASDVCYYPRSNKIYFRGLGLVARLEDLDYDDGEPR